MHKLICQYCDFKWEQPYVYKYDLKCAKCGDKNVEDINLSIDKVDYYKGAPPFPPKDVISYDSYL